MKIKSNDNLCQRCKKNEATLNYADSYLNATHGFIEHICQECYDKIRDNNAWYKEGVEAGKSLILQEVLVKILHRWDKLIKMKNTYFSYPIAKELEDLKNELTDLSFNQIELKQKPKRKYDLRRNEKKT